MTFGKDTPEDPRPYHPEEDDDDWDCSRLCPECEGRGYVVYGLNKELCMTCDGLGVVYDE